jgi:hypothetical protein
MRKVSVKQQIAIAYLTAHPELHATGAKRLAAEIDNPKLSRMTWHRAKAVLGCPSLPAGGQGSYGNTYYERKTAQTPNLDETVSIEVDKPLLTIRFHRRNGLQVQRSKPNRKYLNASLALFEHQGWVTVEERGGVVTLRKS